MIFQRAETAELLGQPPQGDDPLAENDGLAAAAGNFVQIGLQPLQLGAGAGGRIEVADLLQPQHELENVADRGGVAQLGQPQHALFFGQPVALPLLGRSIPAARRGSFSAAGREAPGPSCARNT